MKIRRTFSPVAGAITLVTFTRFRAVGPQIVSSRPKATTLAWRAFVGAFCKISISATGILYHYAIY